MAMASPTRVPVQDDGDSPVMRLPEELITNILTRLPVKSLLRLTRVSKAWRSLIRSPAFARAHILLTAGDVRRLFLVASDRDEGTHSSVHSLARDDDSSLISLHPLDSPPPFPCGSPTIVGACDGILCLTPGGCNLFLWNPATGTSWELPAPFGSDCCVRFGFGYHEKSQDYKVVKISSFESSDGSGYGNNVQIYSLKANSWTSIYNYNTGYTTEKWILSWGFEGGYIHNHGGVFLKGALHWDVCHRNSPPEILAVDLDKADKYRTIPFPTCNNEKEEPGMRLEVLWGHLALCLFSPSEKTVEVWVMKEYADAGSWIRMVYAQSPADLEVEGDVSVLYASQDWNEFLFNLGDQLVCHNVNGGSLKKLEEYDWTSALRLQSATYSETTALLHLHTPQI
ncbi:unnamed protein product [Cuscuta campestris]|uniref:F-box domain-containing protein n=1 Tax=Cuscuta campestris TaxID=132261 RepID=A0A484KHU3_9ASTE|nr:unnamed protein product [Cuscuta campestris]